MLRRLYCAPWRWPPRRARSGGSPPWRSPRASCFPIPPDALLIPMALARPRAPGALPRSAPSPACSAVRWVICIGYAVFDQLARPLIRLLRLQRPLRGVPGAVRAYGLWVILIKGLTPIPYKIVTIASGAAKFNFSVFMVGQPATRGARFFMVAALLRFFGTPVRDFIERRLTLVTSLFAAGVVGGFLVLKLL